MKHIGIVGLALALLGTWANDALARGRVHTEFGVYLGDPFFWGPRPYPYPYYYDAPRTVIIEREPSVYIQQPPAAPAAPPAQPQTPLWYWCPNPAGYYPHIPQCQQQWVPVDPRTLPPTGQ